MMFYYVPTCGCDGSMHYDRADVLRLMKHGHTFKVIAKPAWYRWSGAMYRGVK